MDKCREEFEVIARSNGWNLTTYPEITERIDYVNNLTEQAWQMYQHQQAKVEELQKRVDKAIRLLVEAELYQSEPNIDLAVKALKGEG
ncbi:TPA: hypothetical protein ACNH4J_003559 [Acinetobacter baumannii]|nr:hypothetical protein [Acinetobacter baumannii]